MLVVVLMLLFVVVLFVVLLLVVVLLLLVMLFVVTRGRSPRRPPYCRHRVASNGVRRPKEIQVLVVAAALHVRRNAGIA